MSPLQTAYVLPTTEDRLREVVRTLSSLLDWKPTDDARITCIVCGEVGCNIETMARGNGPTSWYGAHSECLRGPR